MLRAHTSAHQADLIRMGLDNFLVIGDVYRFLTPFQNMIHGPRRVTFRDYTIPASVKLRWINSHHFIRNHSFNLRNGKSPVRHRT